MIAPSIDQSSIDKLKVSFHQTFHVLIIDRIKGHCSEPDHAVVVSLNAINFSKNNKKQLQNDCDI